MAPIESIKGIGQKPSKLFRSMYHEQAEQINGIFAAGQIAQIDITGTSDEVNKIISGLRAQLLKPDPELKYYTRREKTENGYILYLSTNEFD